MHVPIVIEDVMITRSNARDSEWLQSAVQLTMSTKFAMMEQKMVLMWDGGDAAILFILWRGFEALFVELGRTHAVFQK
jgi:hypothetical protein